MQMTEALEVQCVSTGLSLVCVQTITLGDTRHKRVHGESMGWALEPEHPMKPGQALEDRARNIQLICFDVN